MKKLIFVLASFLIGCTITGNVVVEEIQGPEVYFCPRDNCGQQLYNAIISAQDSVHCAFYDLDLEEITMALEQQSRFADVKLVMDDNNYINKSFIKKDNKGGLMHNKFCVIDSKTVLTGSFNPTYNGNNKNNNNLVIFNSPALAKNYDDEFEELWEGVFGKGERTQNTKIGNIENYFCPEDWCTNRVLYALSRANRSIYFMTFSFTSDQIGDYLIKKHNQGIEVKGVFEKSQNNPYSEYKKLEEAGLNVTYDTNPKNMHHKVFIIDNETVVTGSFNPTANAETRNDENIIIIHDKKIAEKFAEEFARIYK